MRHLYGAAVCTLMAVGALHAAPPAAEVNGEAISLAELEAIYQLRPPAVTPPTSETVRAIKLEILNRLIDEMLVMQFLRKYGPKIESAELDRKMAALEAGQKAQGKTMADFYRENQQTETQVRNSLMCLLQMDAYIKGRVSDAELRKYYDEFKDYFDKVTVRAQHIVIRLPLEAPAVDRAEATKKLQDLRAEIAAGKLEFAEAAKKHSMCPSAVKGGDLGFVLRKWQGLDESFAKAAFALKPGEVSDVVTTEFGVHLIKVTERTAGTPTTFEQVRDDVRDSYMAEVRQQMLTELRKTARIVVNLP